MRTPTVDHTADFRLLAEPLEHPMGLAAQIALLGTGLDTGVNPPFRSRSRWYSRRGELVLAGGRSQVLSVFCSILTFTAFIFT